MIPEVLLDNSAFTRIEGGAVGATRATELAEAVEVGRVVVCTPFLLEAGYSARNGAHHHALIERLLTQRFVPVSEDVEERALQAQAQLAAVGHHRLPPMDILIAALAERHELGVLHYDADFDVLAERTDLRFASVWLAPRGSL